MCVSPCVHYGTLRAGGTRPDAAARRPPAGWPPDASHCATESGKIPTLLETTTPKTTVANCWKHAGFTVAASLLLRLKAARWRSVWKLVQARETVHPPKIGNPA